MTEQHGVVPAAVGAVLAVGLWFALVPHDDPSSAGARVPAFWWIMVAAAFVLGLGFGPSRAVVVAAALTLPQFVLAFWTAPRGDNDGLWVYWMPLLLVFGAFLVLPAWAGGRVRERAGRS